MNETEFKEIIKKFSDSGKEISYEKNKFTLTVYDNEIKAKIIERDNNLFISENSADGIPAKKWITDRLARLPLLCSGLKEHLQTTDHFIIPAATLIPALDEERDDSYTTGNALEAAMNILDKRSSTDSHVIYITSDAGEGKTSLINQMAKIQTEKFINKEVDWLIVPITLGGRTFLRFDDITVGMLQNRYRFPYLYYDTFIELVKMGVIVPAFDGFEEVFVEGSTGEAFSAIGTLLGALDSKGTIIVAARKAYFEFENLSTKERLFDTIRQYKVIFERVELQRWGKQQFLDYCRERGLNGAERIYNQAVSSLNENHALLTRAVLVKKFVDEAEKSTESAPIESFLSNLHNTNTGFFYVFIKNILSREAKEKWLTKSETPTPLLTVEEHIYLLSMVASEMWLSKITYMKLDYLDMIVEFFSNEKKLTTEYTYQIRERLRHHAMLIKSKNSSDAVEFDHDEFRQFFLGEYIADCIKSQNSLKRAELMSIFRKDTLPNYTHNTICYALERNNTLSKGQLIDYLFQIIKTDDSISYVKDNCGEVIIRLLDNFREKPTEIENMSFSSESLADKSFYGVSFVNCLFSSINLAETRLTDCKFVKCNISKIRTSDTHNVENTTMDECTIDALTIGYNEGEERRPYNIKCILQNHGFQFNTFENQCDLQDITRTVDSEIKDIEKITRYFLRSTHITRNVILTKLSPSGQQFIDRTLPQLIRRNIIREVQYVGQGAQRRFCMGYPLEKINSAISQSCGSFEKFLNIFTENS